MALNAEYKISLKRFNITAINSFILNGSKVVQLWVMVFSFALS